jgi:hypothetical protein
VALEKIFHVFALTLLGPFTKTSGKTSHHSDHLLIVFFLSGYSGHLKASMPRLLQVYRVQEINNNSSGARHKVRSWELRTGRCLLDSVTSAAHVLSR